MTASFKIYGYNKKQENQGILELSQVSLCFLSPDEMLEFAKFVEQCAIKSASKSAWEHEHFMTIEGEYDVVVDILDQKNY